MRPSSDALVTTEVLQDEKYEAQRHVDSFVFLFGSINSKNRGLGENISTLPQEVIFE